MAISVTSYKKEIIYNFSDICIRRIKEDKYFIPPGMT